MKNILLMIVFINILFAEDHVIVQEDKIFKPGLIHAKVGDTLTFRNDDEDAHNAYTDNIENEFDIGMQKPDHDRTITLKGKGTVNVECAIHPHMKLTIEVE